MYFPARESPLGLAAAALPALSSTRRPVFGQAMAQVLEAVGQSPGTARTTAGIVRLRAEGERLDEPERRVGLTSSSSGMPSSSDKQRRLAALGRGPVAAAPATAQSDSQCDPVRSSPSSR